MPTRILNPGSSHLISYPYWWFIVIINLPRSFTTSDPFGGNCPCQYINEPINCIWKLSTTIMNAFRRSGRNWALVINHNSNYLIRSFNINASGTLHSNYLNKSIKSKKPELADITDFCPIVYSEGDVNWPSHEVVEKKY